MSDLDLLGDVRVESLIDLDHDLREALPEEDLRRARRALAMHTISIAPGEGEVLLRLGERQELTGFLVTEGLVLREVAIESRSLPELLGPGDVVNPPVTVSTQLPVRLRITALAATRMAVLGPSFARACGHWPALLGELSRRSSSQNQRLAIQGAIAQMGRVDVRLLALLWHLADRWGRVSSDGIRVPFTLTHEMLGSFVGAERPTVTLAVGQLQAEGLIERSDDKTWLVRHESKERLREDLGEGDDLPSAVGRARQTRR